MIKKAPTQQRKVWAFLKGRGDYGATDEEGMALLQIGESYRPRRIALVDAGLVNDSGRTRETRSGRNAVVWVACK